MIDPQVATDAPAQLLQSLLERRHIQLYFRIVGGEDISTPTRRIGLGCCARAASGHAATPPTSAMNSRRFTR
jgi:hypothetical protein